MHQWEVNWGKACLLIGWCWMNGLWGTSSPFCRHPPILASQEQLALKGLRAYNALVIILYTFTGLVKHCCTVCRSFSYVNPWGCLSLTGVSFLWTNFVHFLSPIFRPFLNQILPQVDHRKAHSVHFYPELTSYSIKSTYLCTMYKVVVDFKSV
jgi:hypothetical protein